MNCNGALEAVASWPVTTVAVAVVTPDGVLSRVGPDDVLPWASVTKLVSALAALVAVEQGAVELDEPAGPPGSTVRHLLAHASGLAPDENSVIAPPGRRRIYSNSGFEALADRIAERCGISFEEHLRRSVLQPLGMTATTLAGSPAHGARGPLGDLVRLAGELLVPTIAPGLRDEATSPVFPGLSGVLPGFGRQNPNDWGLGFELRDHKRPHWTGEHNSPGTFGHFGRSGTFLWVDPAAKLACACLTDREFGPWAAEVWPRLSDDVLRECGRA
jgi:CubicO group peptidase (beta-lactamase class C family)